MVQPKKNLLQICVSPYEGGREASTVQLAETFKSEGFNSFCACFADSFIERKLQQKNINHIVLEEQKHFSWGNIRKLKKYIKANQIEVIFVHRLKDLWLTYWMKRKFKHLKIIVVTHGYIQNEKKTFWHRLIYKQINQVVTLTVLQKDHVMSLLPVPAEKYVVIPNGVDGDSFSPQEETNPERIKLRKSLGIDKENELLVGMIGRFDVRKGHLELIEAIKTLKNKLPNVRYILVGADTFRAEPMKRKILEEILLNGLETHVQLRGFNEDIPKLMKALDIFIMPSHRETFGSALLEAMACEKICISTNVGGPVEILDRGQYGLLIEPRSSKAIEEGIFEVVKNLKKYQEKAKNARKRVQQKYRSRDVLEKLKELTV